MNMRPVYICRLRDSLRGMIGFFGIFVLVMALSLLGSRGEGRFFMTGAYEMAAAITIFVFGICSIREDMRLASQNGVGRNSAFIGAALASLTVALALAVAGELLCVVFGLFARGMDNVDVRTLYEVLYQNGRTGFVERLNSVLVAFSANSMCILFGCLLSMLFYRLTKIWRVLVSVAAPILMFTVLPVALVRAGLLNASFVRFLIRVASSPYTFSAAMLILALVNAVLGWLLMRRAPIRAAK